MRSPLRRFAAIVLLVLCVGAASTGAQAQNAVFTLQDQTNLTPGTYRIYAAGFSTAGPYLMQQDGSWAMPAPPTTSGQVIAGVVPCWQFVGPTPQISQVQINGAQTNISARVYYFVVTDNTIPACAPTSAGAGLFNVPNAFTTTFTLPPPTPQNPNPVPVFAVTVPPVSQVTSTQFPAWTFSEIGASSTSATIDLSQVDFFSFPMNTTAAVTSGPSVIGNPVGADNPAAVVNHGSVRDSYTSFIDGLARAANNNQSCAQSSSPSACAYLALSQSIQTPGSAVAEYVIQNPGGYLGQNTPTTQASPLNLAFDGVINALWHSASPPTLTIDTGGILGPAPGVPQDVFTSQIVSIAYPGTSYMVAAMKFTGTAASGNYVAYIFSPRDVQNGCAPPTPQLTAGCPSPASTGYQVFAGDGALNTPSADVYTPLFTGGLLSSNAATYGAAGYNAVVGRLGFLISAAMNRGVALVSCTRTYTWQCWQDETYWYPTQTSVTYPDITQNIFSRWMHTATIGGVPMFKQPPGAVRSASGTPGTGPLMGMAYGFAADENPTPPATTPAQPEVPSKLDQTVSYGAGAAYTITFGPWVTSAATPTLAVINVGSGTVTSSLAGITCNPTCSQAFAAGTPIVLTASPAPGWVFSGWSGGVCSGASTTCSFTLTQTTTVTATFLSTAQPSLTVVVNGSGNVTSAPPGIACGAQCSTSFAPSTVVTLTAAPSAGYVFAGWNGACTGTSLTCNVTMTGPQLVGASFVHATQHTLTTTVGAGGSVVSTPAGIDCGTRCAAGFTPGTPVSLVAQPQPGYQFVGWSGACSGSQTCDVVMNANRSVQATFALVGPGQYSLTVQDFGLGTIVSLPGGINCGTACSAVYTAGTEVTLFATPGATYRFAGWGGACTGVGACVVRMDNIQLVSAVFVPSAAPPQQGEPIPTLSQWALMLLCLMMLAVGCRAGPRAGRAQDAGRGERI